MALRFEDLAGQPLLLFMLALYNADGDALRSEGAEMAKARLYEQLLTRFARREVAKSLHDALDHQVDRAVEEELIRLSVVAFAMFNRGVQWVDEAELDADLNALLPSGPRGVPQRLRLSSAQLAVGRFFFVHAARAAHDGRVSQTYEFLHATFGEYLVARLVHRVALEVLASERAARSPYGRQSSDTGWLEPVLSFTPLSTRHPVVTFLRELFDGTPEADSTALHDLFTGLIDTAQHRPPGLEHPDYVPRVLPIAQRIAAYTANLVVLAVVVRGEFAVPGRHRWKWRSLASLWESQLGEEEWDSLTWLLEIVPVPNSTAGRVVFRGDDSFSPIDLAWLLEIPATDPHGVHFTMTDLIADSNRAVNLRMSWRDAYLLHTLEPLAREVPGAFVVRRKRVATLANLLLTVLMAQDPGERVEAYEMAFSMLEPYALPDERPWQLFFKALADDPAATVPLLEKAVAYPVDTGWRTRLESRLSQEIGNDLEAISDPAVREWITSRGSREGRNGDRDGVS
ncbi:MAG: hypothetical protein HOV94_14010 [Saccharothrix sp.]|nr:hypothetical protein [Saccharothrix sp.]